MFTIRQPSKIIFGSNSMYDFSFPDNSLIITSSGAKSRGWLNFFKINPNLIFDSVEPNPSMETVEKILELFRNSKFEYVIGIGGGSVLDVSKFVAFKLHKKKILIPTTFGSGSEVTRISVLKINNKKQSFHDDELLADISIIDSNFLKNTPSNIYRNSAIDACAQATEGYDSKIANNYTKFLCLKGFDFLEDGIINKNSEKLAYGSLLTGLGFGNASTTLGHALSYPFSNEGISHGHALAFTTTIAHKFNNSKFYERFQKLVKLLNFPSINLEQDLESAANTIMTDRKHLDNNPRNVSKSDLLDLLIDIKKIKNNF